MKCQDQLWTDGPLTKGFECYKSHESQVFDAGFNWLFCLFSGFPVRPDGIKTFGFLCTKTIKSGKYSWHVVVTLLHVSLFMFGNYIWFSPHKYSTVKLLKYVSSLTGLRYLSVRFGLRVTSTPHTEHKIIIWHTPHISKSLNTSLVKKDCIRVLFPCVCSEWVRPQNYLTEGNKMSHSVPIPGTRNRLLKCMFSW